MPVTKVNRSYNAAALITYLEGEAHDNSGIRNVIVSSRHLHPQQSYLDQLRVYMSKRSYHSAKKRKIEAIAISQSFAADELDPNDPDSAYACHEIGVQLAAEQFPNCPCIVYTQHDGKGHLYHNHIVVFNADVMDYKAISYKDYNLYRIRYLSDKITKKYGIEISKSLNRVLSEKKTNAEYRRISLKNEYEIKTKEYGDNPTETQQQELRELYEKSYSWKQDLKERVSAAMADAISEQDFLENQLPAHGLSYSRIGKKKDPTKKIAREMKAKEYGETPTIDQKRELERMEEQMYVEYITYELTDRSNIPQSSKDFTRKRLAASSDGLGFDYTLKHLRDVLEEKEAAASKTIPKAVDTQLIETSKNKPEVDNASIPPPPVQDTSSISVGSSHTMKKRKRNGKMKFDDEHEKNIETPVQTIDLKIAKKVIHNEVTQYENDISQQICDDLQDLFDRYTSSDDILDDNMFK